MRTFNVLLSCMVVVLFCFVAFDARGDDNKHISLESLIGKYEGTMQIHRGWKLEYQYQTEIISVDKVNKTLSLVAYCQKCEISEWKRNNCNITEELEKIKFICKGKTSDEEYTFNGETLRASGNGKLYPYSISVTKIVK